MDNSPKFIVVIGASAGGINASRELISQINGNVDAAIFVILHLSGKAISDILVQRLQNYTSLVCRIPKNGEAIKKGTVYVAPSDSHMLVKKGKILIGQGPAENRWRPSIDVLFRSASVAYTSRVIGIVLTGLLNDGTFGMMAIKKCGGICIVQDPNKAEFPDMPLSVLNSMETDYCVELSEMGAIIRELTQRSVPSEVEPPAEVAAEAEMAERASTSIGKVKEIGVKSIFVCPDCGGGLWHMKDDGIERYRCHVGHVYSERDLNTKQGEALEATLWVALRMMEERNSLLEKMANDERKKGLNTLAASKDERRADLQKHIDNLKEILFSEHRQEEKGQFGERV
jgi:two-component system, chemotaxis family, protein-glutamate methylesterase/glutaminase